MLAAGALLLMATSGAGAADQVAKNDGWASGEQAHCQNAFGDGEAAAVGLDPPATHYPLMLKSIQMVVCGDATDTLGLEIYADSLDGTPEPGALLFPKSGTATYSVTGPDTGAAMRSINLASRQLVMKDSFRVALRWVGTDGVVVEVTIDDDGTITPQRNFIHATGSWAFSESFLVDGDFVIRATYARVLCQQRRPTKVGTAGADALKGTANRDVIASLNGDDTVTGAGKADGICLGGGNDEGDGGGGADVMDGQDGRDRLTGAAGDDVLRGGPGGDVLRGGPGRDVCIGGPGFDRAVGCEVRRSV